MAASVTDKLWEVSDFVGEGLARRSVSCLVGFRPESRRLTQHPRDLDMTLAA